MSRGTNLAPVLAGIVSGPDLRAPPSVLDALYNAPLLNEPEWSHLLDLQQHAKDF